MRGIVKWFSPEKKFGFLIASDGKEIFVHGSDILVDVLLDGQHVEFDTEQGHRGPKAKRVKVVTD